MPRETVYLETNAVKVTSARLVIHGGKSYAMSQVTSVSRLTIPPDNKLAVQLIFGGLVLTLCCIGIIPLIIGILMMAIAKTNYALVVRTSGGEGQFLVGSEPDNIDEVVEAINEAIIGRS